MPEKPPNEVELESPGTEPESETEDVAEVQADADGAPVEEVDGDADVAEDAAAEAVAEPEGDVEAEPDAATEADADVLPDAEPDAEPEAEPEPEPEPEIGPEALREMAYIVESVVFAAGTPVPVKELARILTLPGESAPSAKTVRAATKLLFEEYAPGRHGIVFLEVAGGFQFRTARENADFVRQVFKEKPARLGRAALETLAIVAYKQPATKADIEGVRGVDADGALNTLLAKRLIKIAGRKEAIGRPLLYATTPEFLEAFGLKDLRDLPALDEIAPPTFEEEPDAREAEDDEETTGAADAGGRDDAALADAPERSDDTQPLGEDDESQEDQELGHAAQGPGEGGLQLDGSEEAELDEEGDGFDDDVERDASEAPDDEDDEFVDDGSTDDEFADEELDDEDDGLDEDESEDESEDELDDEEDFDEDEDLDDEDDDADFDDDEEDDERDG